MTSAPAITLYDYQQRWVGDGSRFKKGCWCRQSGKSFAVSLEAVDDAVSTGADWVLLSAGERQSKELMEKALRHTEAYGMAAADLREDFFADTETRQLSMRLPNRARLIGLPANPDTARGFSANVILDEFAFHRDSYKIWAALFPIISRGYKIRVVSTPQGRNNQFYKLFTGDNDYSRHFTDIYTAVKEGLPVDVDQLRAGLDDPDAWAQEYECQFIDEASSFLTYELIGQAESDQALAVPNLGKPLDAGEYYLGVDIGRKHDLTVVWILQKLGDVYWTKGLIILDKMPFHQQHEAISAAIRLTGARRVCIDSTGLGAQLAEDLQRAFGTFRVEPVQFTNAIKGDLAMRTLRNFQDHRIRIPVDAKLREDLHSVKKVVTAAGNIRFDAERTADGHADRFWAMALALMASDQGAIKPGIEWL
jgi:phage FluMu gp28-like protein